MSRWPGSAPAPADPDASPERLAISLDDFSSTTDRPDAPTAAATAGGGDRPILRLGLLERQLKGIRRRIQALQPGRSGDLPELFEVLDATMEELRVAVEELRHSNQALLETRAEVEAERRRYRDLFDLAPDAYLVTDLQGVVREANRAALMQLNLDAHFLLGKPLFVFLPEPDRPAFRAEVRNLRDATEASEHEVRLKPRRLPTFDASIRIGVVRDAWGSPVALRWSIRDVSDRKRAEGAIKALNQQLQGQVAERSEQLESSLQTNERWLIKAHAAADETPGGSFFRDIVEEVDAILWRADADTGRYTFVSRRAEELLGFPSSRWLEDAEFWLSRVHPEDRALVAGRRKQLREGVDLENEYRVVAADGRTLWFREVIRVLGREPDGPAALYGLMVNISKRKKVERQLQTSKGELASELRDLKYLHELGRRLAATRGTASTHDEILSAAVSLQGAEMAMLWLLDDGRGTPTLHAELGLPAEFARSAEARGLAPEVLGDGPISIEDVATEPGPSAWREAGRAAGFRAVAVVPLSSAVGEPIGAIVTAFRGPYRMGDRQARLVAMYAEQAAGAIEAARTLDRIQRSDRRKAEALGAIDGQLAEILPTLDAPDPREAIRTQVVRIRQLLPGG